MNTYDLNGRTMVLAGGSGGIGLAAAKLAQKSGARVYIWDLRAPEHADGIGFIACDLTDSSSIAEAREQTMEAGAKIDILVNCAGIIGQTAAVGAYPEEDWRRVIDVNLTGSFLCSQAVVPGMKDQGYGRIVNLSSIAGKEGNANQSAYSAAKAAVIALTKSMGKELAQSGVLVNCITPAVIETELIFQMTEVQRNTVLSKIPVGRPGKAEEVANMIVWLCSEQCSFSTGAVFDLSGGRATY